MTEKGRTKQPDEMYCTSCRALIKRGVQFCTQCGTRVGGAQTASREVGKLGVVWEQRDRRPLTRRLTEFARAHKLASAGLLLWFVAGLYVLAIAIWVQIQIEQETDLILEISRQFREQGRDFEALEVLVNYEERDNWLIVPAATWVLVNIGLGIGLVIRMAGFPRKKVGGNIQENGPPK